GFGGESRWAPRPGNRGGWGPPPPRPPVLLSPSIRLFSGLPLCSSCLSTSTTPRRAGEGGLNCFSAISEPRRDVDGLAFGQGDDGLLHVGAAANLATEALGLALHVEGVDLDHVDLEEVLDRLGDLGLGGVLGDAEDHLVLLGQHRRLLGDHRSEDGVVVAGGGHQDASPSAAALFLGALALAAALALAGAGVSGSAAATSVVA